MQQFTQKYAIIQLFETVPVGAEFASTQWPLHSTLVDTFAIDWSQPKMIEELTGLLSAHSQANSVVEDDRLFGEAGDVRVALLRKTDELVQLHYDLVTLLEGGGLKLNDPPFSKEGFLPHSTVQPHARLTKGDRVSFTALSIIDFFPHEDPFQRKVLATIPVGGK